MPKETVVGEFEGNEFVLENTWFSGAKLFHESELVASNNDLFSLNKNKSIMSAKIMIGEVERFVEVYAYAMFTVKLQIRIDGKKIAGDDF